jgi:hypothetical protein
MTFLHSALIESNDILQEELTRYRRVNKILRIVNRRLRTQVTIAHANDEAFKNLCLSEITADMED